MDIYSVDYDNYEDLTKKILVKSKDLRKKKKHYEDVVKENIKYMQNFFNNFMDILDLKEIKLTELQIYNSIYSIEFKVYKGEYTCSCHYSPGAKYLKYNRNYFIINGNRDGRNNYLIEDLSKMNRADFMYICDKLDFFYESLLKKINNYKKEMNDIKPLTNFF